MDMPPVPYLSNLPFMPNSLTHVSVVPPTSFLIARGTLSSISVFKFTKLWRDGGILYACMVSACAYAMSSLDISSVSRFCVFGGSKIVVDLQTAGMYSYNHSTTPQPHCPQSSNPQSRRICLMNWSNGLQLTPGESAAKIMTVSTLYEMWTL